MVFASHAAAKRSQSVNASLMVSSLLFQWGLRLCQRGGAYSDTPLEVQFSPFSLVRFGDLDSCDDVDLGRGSEGARKFHNEQVGGDANEEATREERGVAELDDGREPRDGGGAARTPDDGLLDEAGAQLPARVVLDDGLDVEEVGL